MPDLPTEPPRAGDRRPQRGIRLLRLRLSGVTRPYEVDFRGDHGAARPLSVIAGPTNTGKTSVLRLVAYALGASDYPDHEEIVRQVRAALLETVMPSGPATIERALESRTALVFDVPLDQLSETVAQPYPVEPAGDPASLSQLLLSTVDLQDVQLREAPMQQQSGTDPLSFRDLMWLCTILNERVGSTQLLFEGNHNKNLKLIQVVDAVFGVHENAAADLANRIRQQAEELGHARRELNALETFVREQDATPREQLRQAVEDADSELAAIREAIVRLDAEEAAAVDVAVELRRRHQAAGREAVRAQRRVRDREALVNRFASLRAQYADDLRKLTLLKQAGSVFDQLSVRVCPACLAELPTPPRVRGAACGMCNQPVPTGVTSLTLGSAAVARETPVSGLGSRPAGTDGAQPPVDEPPDESSAETADRQPDGSTAQQVVQAELASTRRRFNELNSFWLQLDESLAALREASSRADAEEATLAAAVDRAAAGKVTPYVSARENLLARRQQAMVRRDRANAALKQWRGVDARRRRIDRHAEDLADLRRQQRGQQTRPNRASVITALGTRFRQILTDFDYPKHAGTGAIDDKLIPSARMRPYRNASSGGMVLQTLAWILAVFEVAYEQDGNHPGFLLIDTPQKNLGGAAAHDDEEFADVHLVEHFYTHIIDWLAGPGRGAQIIVVDNTPPSIADPHVVVRFTRDPNRGRYGLIDNETS
jgi:hypothetical protein